MPVSAGLAGLIAADLSEAVIFGSVAEIGALVVAPAVGAFVVGYAIGTLINQNFLHFGEEQQNQLQGKALEKYYALHGHSQDFDAQIINPNNGCDVISHTIFPAPYGYEVRVISGYSACGRENAYGIFPKDATGGTSDLDYDGGVGGPIAITPVAGATAFKDLPESIRREAVGLLSPPDWQSAIDSSPSGGTFHAGDVTPRPTYVDKPGSDTGTSTSSPAGLEGGKKPFVVPAGTKIPDDNTGVTPPVPNTERNYTPTAVPPGFKFPVPTAPPVPGGSTNFNGSAWKYALPAVAVASSPGSAGNTNKIPSPQNNTQKVPSPASKQNAPNCNSEDACGLGAIKNQTKDNNSLLNQVNATLSGLNLANGAGIGALLNTINSKLGAQITGGIGGKLVSGFKWLQLDRALGLLTFAATVQNHIMLSNNVGQTLIGALTNIVTLMGLKDDAGNPFDLGTIINSTIENFVKGIVGAENYTTISETWAKANRIYQATTNVLNSFLSLSQTILQANELIAGYTGKIGNALKKGGVVLESAYGWLNPQPKFNRVTSFLEGLQQGASTIQMVTQAPLDVVNATTELTTASTAFVTAIKEDDKPANKAVTVPEPDQLKAKESNSKTTSQPFSFDFSDLFDGED